VDIGNLHSGLLDRSSWQMHMNGDSSFTGRVLVRWRQGCGRKLERLTS